MCSDKNVREKYDGPFQRIIDWYLNVEKTNNWETLKVIRPGFLPLIDLNISSGQICPQRKYVFFFN